MSTVGHNQSVCSVQFPGQCSLSVIFSQFSSVFLLVSTEGHINQSVGQLVSQSVQFSSVQFSFLASVHRGSQSVSQFSSVPLPLSTEGHIQSVSSVQFPCQCPLRVAFSQFSSVPLPMPNEGHIQSVRSVLFPCQCPLWIPFSQPVRFSFLDSVH